MTKPNTQTSTAKAAKKTAEEVFDALMVINTETPGITHLFETAFNEKLAHSHFGADEISEHDKISNLKHALLQILWTTTWTDSDDEVAAKAYKSKKGLPEGFSDSFLRNAKSALDRLCDQHPDLLLEYVEFGGLKSKARDLIADQLRLGIVRYFKNRRVHPLT